MKKHFKEQFLITKCFSIICIAVMLAISIFRVNNSLPSNNFSHASKTREISNYSVFMHNPTYSCLYDSKIYFIDDYDMYLKIYDIETAEFSSEYLPLSTIGTIKDATYLNGNIFILAEKDSYSIIYSIDLKNNLNIKTIFNELNPSYTKLSVSSIVENDNEFYVLTLTPSVSTDKLLPLVLFVEQETLEFSKKIFVSFDSALTLDKFFMVQATFDDSHIHFIYFFNSKVAYSTFEFAELIDNTELSAVPKDTGAVTDNSNSIISISNINMITISNTNYFVITYANNARMVNESYSRFYKYNIAHTDTATSFTYIDAIESENNPYLLTSSNYVIYPTRQTITYIKIEEGSPFSKTKVVISNPKVSVTYYTETEFKYYTTNSESYLLDSPWNESSEVVIPDSTDVICIGFGVIETSKTTVKDFYYCLYTFNGMNSKGYIFADNLTEKPQITGTEDGYNSINPQFRVVANTNLYSLPTKVTGDLITDELTSTIVIQIKNNSVVKLLDYVCGYTTENGKFIKVQVNDNEIGYIDISKIITPNETTDFVITNAKIKTNNTNVYLEESSSSVIIYTLDKGYNIRIDGAKNTKTGYTKITFNDEYGNEFTGYIMTDSLSSDNWSTLQIIGCILIAINIGLLVLILKFKNDRIGKAGQKYVKNKKPNYKENNLTTNEE